MLKLKKREKGKGKNFYRNEMLTPEEIVHFSLTLSEQVFNNFFFTMYVLSQTLTNAARPIPSKWTNAIRMHLALIPKAHTTVLAILRLLEMVWIVKVSLVLKAMKFLFCFPFECNSKLLRCTSEYMPTVPLHWTFGNLPLLLQGVGGENWRHKNLGIFLKQAITWHRVFFVFFIVYLILPTSNNPLKTISIPADKDFSPVRRYIFRRLNFVYLMH